MAAGDAVAREIAATLTDADTHRHRNLQIITASLITTVLACLDAGGDNPVYYNT
jgi:hypothetical protein